MRPADGEGGGDGADHDRDLLPLGRSSDQKAGLEVLAGGARHFPAATAMTPAMEMAPTRWSTPVHPISRKMVVVPISAAMVIPEIGLALTPISPVMRDDTTTKKKPKMMMRMAPSRLTASLRRTGEEREPAPTAPARVTQIGRSMSVRSRLAASPMLPFRSWKPERNALTMVGSDRIKAMMPAEATAPAPI